MPQLKLLPFNEFSSAAAVFEGAIAPEGTLAWFETLALSTLAEGEEAVLAAAVDDAGQVQAALPLARDRFGALRSLTSPYTTLFAPAFSNAAWAQHLGSELGSVVATVLRLDAMDPTEHRMRAFLLGLQSSKLICARFANFPNWFDVIEQFEDYWLKRPTKLKSTVRRKLAALSKTRLVQFRYERNGPGLESALKAYLDVYGSSWKSAEPHPGFIPTMVKRLGSEGALRLATLSSDDVAIAAQIWLLRGPKATIFKLGHRQDAAEFSPGTLLTHWMLEKLCREEKVQEIDFGRGDDAYKRDWLAQSRQRYGIIAANWRSRAGIGAIFNDILRTRISNYVHARPTDDFESQRNQLS
jgi:CelD/BcsL family acetyltransferase involved in cellulose biosynthesis